MRRSVRNLLARAGFLLMAACGAYVPATAQLDVTSVDIQLATTATPGVIMVRIKPNGGALSSADGLFNMTFTLGWPTASGGTAGAPDQITGFAAPFCAFQGGLLSESPDGEIDNGGTRHQTYNCISSNPFPAGCSFAAGVFTNYARIQTCLPTAGLVNVINDAYTAANNKNFFVSIGGTTLTGVITGAGITPTAVTPVDITGVVSNSPICGSADLTLDATTVGTSPSFEWISGAGTFNPDNFTEDVTVSGPATGTYTLVATNVCNSDTFNTSVTVSAGSTPTITPSGPTTFCAGGSVTLTASAGTSYLWSPGGATTQSILVTTSGTYTVTVTTAGCSGTSAGTTVTVNPNPTPTITPGGPTTFCAGGSVTLTSSAATTYLWSPGGATTQSINATASGTYTVTVTNASGCSGTSAGTTVTVNPNPTPTITPGGPTTFCAGGSVTLTSSAATTYLWSPGGATTQSINATASGTYTVTVTNASGCSGTSAGTTVTVNPNPTPTITPGGPTTFCAGGSVTLTSSAGGSYLWSPGGATTQSINVTSSGTYSVTVTTSGCSGTSAGTTVTVNPNPTPTITPGGPTTFCAGGSVTLTSSAASSYLWSPGGATTQSITVSTSGSYSVTVTDGNGCSGTSAGTTVTVNPNPSATVSTTPVTTVGGSDGTATANPSGGTPGYTYLWSPGGATTQTATGLTAGGYSVVVTDAAGCTTTASGTVGSPNCNLAVTTTHTDVLCNGGSTGTATANPTGASGAVTYVWSPGGQTTQTATGLAAGTYTVTATDAAGCTATATATVGEPPVLSASVSTTPVSTVGGSDGTATATPSGGTPGYTYLWSPGGATTQTATGLTAGGYSVVVTDANGCTTTASGTVGSPNCNLAVTTTHTDVLCNGGSTGTATANPTGASGAVTYVWSPGGQTTQTATGLAAGTYTVTVTDEASCTATATATVGEPAVLQASSSVGAYSCALGTAPVTINASGGTPGYSGTGVFNQGPGTQSYTVTDVNGCTASTTATVTIPDGDGDGFDDCTDSCPLVFGQVGDPCDDLNPGTVGDTLNASCQCVGTPTGCTEILNLDITLDNFGSEVTVELWNETMTLLIDQAGPYANGIGGTTVSDQFCVAPGCYRLLVLDSGNNGISGGGYVLKTAAGKRIIDANGLFGDTSALGNNNPFCVPVSNQGLLSQSCDRTDLLPNTVMYCNSQPGATGYQWWWFDPHGSYSRRILRPFPAMQPYNCVTNPIPYGLDLNIRIRAQIGGTSYTAFGAACRARLNPYPSFDGADQHSLMVDGSSGMALSLYPNPNRDGLLNLVIGGLDGMEHKASIEVYDMFGKRVHDEQVTVTGGEFLHAMDLSGKLTAGMYMVNVLVDGRLMTQRLTMQ